MAFSWASLVPDLLGGIKQYFSRKHELKMKKMDVEFKVIEAKAMAEVQLQIKRQDADIDWERMSIANSGWKDEWFTVFLSLIMVAMFVPDIQPFMIEGFIALRDHTPVWLSTTFVIAVSSSFGVRSFASFMSLTKGSSSEKKMLKKSQELNDKLLEHLDKEK